MAQHQTSGRTLLGLSLAFSTALLWAMLPVALKFALEQTDPWTLTWFRIFTAFLALGGWLALKQGFAGLLGLKSRSKWLLAIAAITLTGNYVAYLLGLHLTTPANSQLLMQVAVVLLAAGGVVLFHERFGRARGVAMVVLVFGLALFFWDQPRAAEADAEERLQGSALILLAAASWAVYALAQKQLLVHLSSVAVLFVVFGVGSLVLLPAADLRSLATVDGVHWIAIVFCSLNTLAAYGAFAESLAHAEASRVSVLLALNPLLTLGVVASAHWWRPDRFPPIEVSLLGYVGAIIAVAGSVATSWTGQRSPIVGEGSG